MPSHINFNFEHRVEHIFVIVVVLILFDHAFDQEMYSTKKVTKRFLTHSWICCFSIVACKNVCMSTLYSINIYPHFAEMFEYYEFYAQTPSS